ncbi:class I SAM-dependent methyltransferase [Aestuariivivens sp. NBU2969]|uniref:class I SAM-dependent methyltransferase n=1 Tax=Aestuariivivens sp. NBU2969 TaxID=2873267 RepID=UPI001CC0DA41|nr:class I SAM-dependent methyltransferase [Aestuariivivens sp. NBU2969]
MLKHLKRHITYLVVSYRLGKTILIDDFHLEGSKKTEEEKNKKIKRFEVINFILKTFKEDTTYLEIGVRDPEDNFNKIMAVNKYSVDPGIENVKNPVDFKLTSDSFFDNLEQGLLLYKEIKFHVVFIDGMHRANQVERDIDNALKYLTEDGFIVLHDCNPPTEFHARENYDYKLSPAQQYWNGTVWKAFFKFRQRNDYYSCCIDSDWGIGVISKYVDLGIPTGVNNPFFEYAIFNKKRKESLNLISFEKFKSKFKIF